MKKIILFPVWLYFAVVRAVLFVAIGVLCLLLFMLVSIIFNVLKKAGFTLSIRGKRRLIRFFRAVLMTKSWRDSSRARRPVAEEPFAINLYETDPVCFIGMKPSEISTILKASHYREGGWDHGRTQVEWAREGVEVECWFDAEICFDCIFYLRDERGHRTEISRTQCY